MPGIGGTGVVTVSQILAAAAQIAGRPAKTVDQTGLSQKAGPVVSTVTIGDAAPGVVDVLLALDVLGAVTPANLAGLDPTRSVAAVSTSIAPTGRMVGKVATSAVDLGPILDEIDQRTRPDGHLTVDASRLVTALLGNAVTANVFMLGVAVQAGFVPLPVAAIEQAIELNGTAVAANRAAFRWGRRWVHDPAEVEQRAATVVADTIEPLPVSGFDADSELRTLVSRRAGDLVAFQNRAYADRYVDVVRRAHVAERAASGDGRFSRTVAQQLHHVMAYKDEYEVARLLLDGRRNVTQQFGEGAELTWNLHPPMLRAMGLKHKMHLGPWSAPMLASLRSMKRLRGTAMDPFGRAHVRRAERQLVDDYIALVDRMITLLPTDAAKATHVVGLVDQVRGYEGVKMANLERYRAALADALG
jgi:indolepyruvate ferredoxin oxidoreductase